MNNRFLSIARQFATALDREDYATVRTLLGENCVYVLSPVITLHGPDAIIGSYEKNGTTAKSRFDKISYTSEVTPSENPGKFVEMAPGKGAIPGGITIPAEESWFIVAFTDHLQLGHGSHAFHCHQHLRVGQDGLIHLIIHEERPEERKRLQDFETQHTASRTHS